MNENGPHRASSWASLLDFVDLPEGCTVLCAGDDAPAMVQELQGRGHRGILLVEQAAPGSLVDADAVVLGRADALPVPDGEFSVILCNGVLHRQDNPEATLEELRRALRPGGLLVIHEPLGQEDSQAVYLSARQLCAHLAGEQLAVMAHRQEAAKSGVALATWVLQVPAGTPERARTYSEEDR